MKKIIFVLLVLVLAAPVMAADPNVTLTVSPMDTNGWAHVNYVADANVRAFALKIEITDVGAVGNPNIVDVNHWFATGECDGTNKGFGIFLDQINGVDINDAGVVQDLGSPVADAGAPGAAGSGIGTKKVIIGMGALYEDGNQPALSGKLCDFQVGPAPCCVKVTVTAESTYRGGVVLEDGNSPNLILTNATSVDLINATTFDTYCSQADICNSAYGNPDCKVTIEDFYWVLGYYGYTCGVDPYCLRADICGTDYGAPDGLVTIEDFYWVLGYYGYTCAQ